MFIIPPTHPRRHYLLRAVDGSFLGLLYQARKVFYSFLSHNLVGSHEELVACLGFGSLDERCLPTCG